MPEINIERLDPGTPENVRGIFFKLHTIILLVGPDGAGKTQFAFEQLFMQLKMAQVGQKKIIISYLNPDQIGRELLDNPTATRYDSDMYQVTDQSRDILLNKVRNLTSYPVNSDFVIVDANCLDPDFRASILEIAAQNHYNVSALIFDFDNKEEYSSVSQAGQKIVPAPGQLKDLRRALSGGINKKDFESIHTIVSKAFNEYQVMIEDYAQYDQYILPEGPEYVVIGDIHGCLSELLLTLNKHGFEIDANGKVTHPDGKRVVLLGDIIDKGSYIEQVIDFVYRNIDTFYLVVGNHENFVVKALRGVIKNGDRPSKAVIDEYFNTYTMLNEPVLTKEPLEPVKPGVEELKKKYDKAMSEYVKHRKDDSPLELDYDVFVKRIMERHEKSVVDYIEDKKEYDELFAECMSFMSLSQEEKDARKYVREKLFVIFDSMKPFFVHKDFIVTHAPCEKKYLGKISTEALKATRDFRYPKTREFTTTEEFQKAFYEHVKFMSDEASNFHPLHIFGHVMTKEVSKFKNKLAIDTGCVAGGKLTSVSIKDDGRRKIEVSSLPLIESSDIYKAELYNFFEQVKSGDIVNN